MTRKLKIAIEELEKLPEEEQDSWAASILEDLRTRREQEEEKDKVEPYSSLDVLMEAKLPGPSDASVTYERELYGREDDLDA